MEMSIMKTAFIFLILLLPLSSAVSSDDQSNLSAENNTTVSDTNIQQSLDAMKELLFSFIQILFALLAIILVVMFAYWIKKKDGILIFPFETVNSKNEYNGKAISELLRAELQRIKYITSTEYEGIENERTNINSEMITKEDAPMAQIGTVNLGPSSISIGELMITIKQLFRIGGRGGQIITGSLETCGSNIKLVACLMGYESCAWTVQTQNNKKLQKDSIDDFDRETESTDQDIFIHELVRDLSFKIAYHLSQERITAKTVLGFRYYTEALDNYQQYLATREINFLDLASKNCIKTGIEPKYKITIGLFLGLGNAYLNEKMYDKAEKILNNIIFKLDPEHAEAWNTKGVALSMQGKHRDAIEAYDKALKLYPNFSNRFNARGADLDGQGKHEDAFKAYREANMLPVYLANVRYNKGLALYDQSKYNEAIKAYDEAIKLNPNFSVAWNNKGCALERQGKYDEAIQAFDKAIQLNPKDELAWISKGATLGQQGKHDESLRASNMAIDLNPQSADAWNNKGQALYMQGKYDDALQALDRAIELNPQLADAWNNKASVLKSLGRIPEADAAFTKARELGHTG